MSILYLCLLSVYKSNRGWAGSWYPACMGDKLLPSEARAKCPAGDACTRKRCALAQDKYVMRETVCRAEDFLT